MHWVYLIQWRHRVHLAKWVQRVYSWKMSVTPKIVFPFSFVLLWVAKTERRDVLTWVVELSITRLSNSCFDGIPDGCLTTTTKERRTFCWLSSHLATRVTWLFGLQPITKKCKFTIWPRAIYQIWIFALKIVVLNIP